MSLTDEPPNGAIVTDPTRHASVPSLNGNLRGPAALGGPSTIFVGNEYVKRHVSTPRSRADDGTVNEERNASTHTLGTSSGCHLAQFYALSGRVSDGCTTAICDSGDNNTAALRNPVLPNTTDSSRNSPLHVGICDTAKSARIDHALAAEGERLVARIIAQHRRSRT